MGPNSTQVPEVVYVIAVLASKEHQNKNSNLRVLGISAGSIIDILKCYVQNTHLFL